MTTSRSLETMLSFCIFSRSPRAERNGFDLSAHSLVKGRMLHARALPCAKCSRIQRAARRTYPRHALEKNAVARRVCTAKRGLAARVPDSVHDMRAQRVTRGQRRML